MTPLIVLLALLLAVSAGVVTVAREPFLVEGAQFFARWANPWRARAASSPQLTPQAVAASASPISFEIPERLHKMEIDLANVAQQIEQIKVSQEQIIRRDAALSDRFKASEEQLIRDNAKAVELGAALEQMDRQNTAVAKQLKENQEQLAELASSRAASFGRKHLRRNSRRAAASALQR